MASHNVLPQVSLPMVSLEPTIDPFLIRGVCNLVLEYCEEKSRLAAELMRAAESYSRAAKVLQMVIHADVATALEDVHRSHVECGNARHALQAHMQKHCC